MASTLNPSSFYSEIISHASLDIMTKLTEYPFPAKQEAKLEAQRRNAEDIVLKKITIAVD